MTLTEIAEKRVKELHDSGAFREPEMRAYLKKAAEETIFYVALGKCLCRDVVTKYGISEEEAGRLLSRVACKLVDDIRSL